MNIEEKRKKTQWRLLSRSGHNKAFHIPSPWLFAVAAAVALQYKYSTKARSGEGRLQSSLLPSFISISSDCFRKQQIKMFKQILLTAMLTTAELTTAELLERGDTTVNTGSHPEKRALDYCGTDLSMPHPHPHPLEGTPSQAGHGQERERQQLSNRT
jgi:hypothetical protein